MGKPSIFRDIVNEMSAEQGRHEDCTVFLAQKERPFPDAKEPETSVEKAERGDRGDRGERRGRDRGERGERRERGERPERSNEAWYATV